MFLGLVDVTPATLGLGVVAAAMIAVNLFILQRLFCVPESPPLSTFVLGTSALVAQMVLWAGTAYYLFVPTVGGFVLFAIAAQFMMVPIGVWFISLVLRHSQRSIDPHRSAWVVAIALLAFSNEFLMSVAFTALVPMNTLGGGYVGDALGSLSTLWYFWPMGATMGALLYWSRLAPAEARALAALTASAFVGPWIVPEPLLAAIAMAGVMAVGTASVLLPWPGAAVPDGPGVRVRAGVLAAFAAMSLGIYASWQGMGLGPASLAPFVLVAAGVMIAETAFLLTKLPSDGAIAPLARASPAERANPSATPGTDS